MPQEFRVRWQREGRGATSRIYQTEQGAREKADRILALEECKADTRFEDMPDLELPPVIDVREVGEWDRAAITPAAPTEESVEGMRDWAAPDDSNYGPF